MPRSALLLGSVVAVSLLTPPGTMDGMGIAPAEAAATSTRKKDRRRTSPKAGAAPTSGGRARVRFTERKGFAKARYASLPKFKPKVAVAIAPPLAAAAPKSVDAAAPSQTGSIRSALAGEGTSLPPDRVIATASLTPATVVHPGAERMRSALEARARSMAFDLGLLPVPLPDAAPAVQISAKSVTFDLEKGQRTVVFGDGETVTAPFDKSRASDIVGIKPASP